MLGYLDQGSFYWDQLVWKQKVISLKPLERSGRYCGFQVTEMILIRAKITLPPPPPQKKPNPKINPQKSHAEFPSLTIKIVQLYINRFCETDAILMR